MTFTQESYTTCQDRARQGVRLKRRVSKWWKLSTAVGLLLAGGASAWAESGNTNVQCVSGRDCNMNVNPTSIIAPNYGLQNQPFGTFNGSNINNGGQQGPVATGPHGIAGQNINQNQNHFNQQGWNLHNSPVSNGGNQYNTGYSPPPSYNAIRPVTYPYPPSPVMYPPSIAQLEQQAEALERLADRLLGQ